MSFILMVTLSTGGHVCRFVPLPGVQTDVSDSFSWTEFLRSAGKDLRDWIPVFVRTFYSVVSKGFAACEIFVVLSKR